MTNSYLDVLSNLFYPQRCVGCERRASDVLCRGCFEALPSVGHPICGRCGAPTAFEVYGCGESSTHDFWFENARAPRRYEGLGEELVHTLKYGGYLPVVKKVMAPLMAGVLSGYPAAISSMRSCRYRCTVRGSRSGASARRSSWPGGSHGG
jgi:competence protein ComFC